MNAAQGLRWAARLGGRVMAGAVAGAVALGGTSSFAQGDRPTSGETTYWLPQDVSTVGWKIDQLFNGILWLTSIVCIAVFVVMLVFMWRYRHRPGRRAAFIHGNNALEAVWTMIPAVILVLIAVFSQAVWTEAKVANAEKPADGDLHIAVIAQQFSWNFQYPGADGKLGPRRWDLMDKNSSDFAAQIGLDRSHPDAQDDFVTPVMVVPANRRVFIDLTSKDVIHSFFLPNFRIKQDAVPGLLGRIWLEATQTGAEVIGSDPGNPLRSLNNETFEYVTITDAKPFDIVCAELCGQGHFKMRGQMYVVTDEEYRLFVETERSNVAAATGGGGDDGYGGGY